MDLYLRRETTRRRADGGRPASVNARCVSVRNYAQTSFAYFELPAVDVPAMKQFYGALFGWNFQDWGEDYTAFSEAGLEGGINADPEHKTKAPLAIVQTDDIEAMEAKVQESGGRITRSVFQYPGGRRFHFTDPSGNELAVMQLD